MPQTQDSQRTHALSETASHTAQEYIASQLELEAEAREALPYQFDSCTKPLGPLRQTLFSCLTCNPDASSKPYFPAGVCYSCSISCHGKHELIELFSKRDFVCDCGTTRLPDETPCSLRHNEKTGRKGDVTGEEPEEENQYNQNFAGCFCECMEPYDIATGENGAMYQCLGLGTVEDGGCGEDWWHAECLMGLPFTSRRNEIYNKPSTPAAQIDYSPPKGFPHEDDFEYLICYKCVAANPWIRPYAGTDGFLPPLFHDTSSEGATISAKRKAKDENDTDANANGNKRIKVQEGGSIDEPRSKQRDGEALKTTASAVRDGPKCQRLEEPTSKPFSMLLKADFREHLCRSACCFSRLAKFPQLLEEEEAYEPPVSESEEADANGRGSVGTGSLLERGEAALSTMDRMKAIEGVMAYNHLRDKVKTFLQPFAESGQAVGAEDVKAYFEKLRGDEEAIRAAAASASEGGSGGDNRREQSGF